MTMTSSQQAIVLAGLLLAIVFAIPRRHRPEHPIRRERRAWTRSKASTPRFWWWF